MRRRVKSTVRVTKPVSNSEKVTVTKPVLVRFKGYVLRTNNVTVRLNGHRYLSLGRTTKKRTGIVAVTE